MSERGWMLTFNSVERAVFERYNRSLTVSKLGRLVDYRTDRSGKGRLEKISGAT